MAGTVQVLLLMFDAQRRRRLADACHAVAAEVRCIESGDELGAALAVAPDRLDLVILDPLLLAPHGAANLVNWWRSSPQAQLLVLETDSRTDFALVEPALLKALH